MKRYRKYIIAISVVTFWAVFAYAYLGVEDGSSGLSILGYIHAFFFIPGGLFFQFLKGFHSNSDLPFMAILSWFIYVLLIVIMVKLISACLKFRCQPKE
jgi:hypothetical protein